MGARRPDRRADNRAIATRPARLSLRTPDSPSSRHCRLDSGETSRLLPQNGVRCAHRSGPRVLTGETRVAATPTTVRQLIGLGYDVLVAVGRRRTLASLGDDEYAEAGARIGSADEAWGADIVLKVNAAGDRAEIGRLRDGAMLVEPDQPGAEPGTRRGAGRAADHGAGDGRRAADLASAVAGRASARWRTSPVTGR